MRLQVQFFDHLHTTTMTETTTIKTTLLIRISEFLLYPLFSANICDDNVVNDDGSDNDDDFGR